MARQRTRGTQYVVLLALLVLTHATGARAQVPSHIPSTPDQQIFNLIKRVTALEQRNAALEQKVAMLEGSKVKAPFQVLDAAGHPIFRVAEGEPVGADVVVVGGAKHGLYVLNSGNGNRVVAVGESSTGDGALVVRDAAGQGIFMVTPTDPGHMAKFLAQGGVAVGGSAEAHGLFVLNDKGESVAALGHGPDGTGALAIRNEQGKTQARLDGHGSLTLADNAGKDVVVAAAALDSSSDVPISLGKGHHGGYIISAKSGNVRAEIGADGKIAAFGAFEGKLPRASVSLVDGDGSVSLSNKQGITTASLLTGSAGHGILELGDASGGQTVWAGMTTDGRGLVKTFPEGRGTSARTPLFAAGTSNQIIGAK